MLIVSMYLQEAKIKVCGVYQNYNRTQSKTYKLIVLFCCNIIIKKYLPFCLLFKVQLNSFTYHKSLIKYKLVDFLTNLMYLYQFYLNNAFSLSSYSEVTFFFVSVIDSSLNRNIRNCLIIF